MAQITANELAAAGEEYRQAVTALDAATERRDDLVRRAVAAGWQQSHIAAAFGISSGRVWQILRAGRQAA